MEGGQKTDPRSRPAVSELHTCGVLGVRTGSARPTYALARGWQTCQSADPADRPRVGANGVGRPVPRWQRWQDDHRNVERQLVLTSSPVGRIIAIPG